MSLAFLLASSTQGHALVHSHIVANNSRLTNHHTHAVIDEKATADRSSGMDLNSSKKSADMRDESRWQMKASLA
jgi:hypothetical protein